MSVPVTGLHHDSDDSTASCLIVARGRLTSRSDLTFFFFCCNDDVAAKEQRENGDGGRDAAIVSVSGRAASRICIAATICESLLRHAGPRAGEAIRGHNPAMRRHGVFYRHGQVGHHCTQYQSNVCLGRSPGELHGAGRRAARRRWHSSASSQIRLKLSLYSLSLILVE